MGGLLHLVQRGGDWAGPQPTQAPPRCTKCNSPTYQWPVYQLRAVRCTTIMAFGVWRVKLLFVSVGSSLDLHKCPLCSKTLTGLKELMVRIFSWTSLLLTDNECCISTVILFHFYRVSDTLTRDIDIGILFVCPSVCLSVRDVLVSAENSLTYCHSFFTAW